MKNKQIGTTLATLALVVLAVVGCSKMFGSSPTASMMLFYNASKNNDADTMKKYLSKASLDMMEKIAKNQNKSLEDYLKDGKMGKGDKDPKVPEVRNEKIDGDSATLEVKDNTSGKWENIPFVKEDGIWKIALDKFMEPDKG